MTLADGRVLGPMKSTFEKKDEAKAFPEWWGKNIGNVERVLPPFTAMTRQGARVSCWGRSYTLDPAGVAGRDHLAGRAAVLAAPARLVVKTGGKETVVAVERQPRSSPRQRRGAWPSPGRPPPAG